MIRAEVIFMLVLLRSPWICHEDPCFSSLFGIVALALPRIRWICVFIFENTEKLIILNLSGIFSKNKKLLGKY